jgi:hypothetical protein
MQQQQQQQQITVPHHNACQAICSSAFLRLTIHYREHKVTKFGKLPGASAAKGPAGK